MKASQGISGRLAGVYIDWYLDCMNWVYQFCFLSKSDLKWLRYDQNRNIEASHDNSGWLADDQLVS